MPVTNPRPEHEGNTRRDIARQRRSAASVIADGYPNFPTQANNDELTLEDDGYAMSFTKGLRHGDNGILEQNAHYGSLVEAINQALATDFTAMQRGITPARMPKTTYSGDALDRENELPTWRGWESPRAGHYYSLEGPDTDAVCMPPAPELGSIELDAEIAEVYALALLRDTSFSDISSSTTATTPSGIAVDDIVDALSGVEWYSDKSAGGLSLQERRRRAARFESHAEHDVNNPPNDCIFLRKDVFRGSSPGVRSGPYVSQFMLQGTQMVRDASGDPTLFSDASIRYGSQEIDQKVTYFPAAVDYMLHWNSYLDVQNGADFGDVNRRSHLPRRFINTPRDLATYVRFDQLYQAYLNACIFMLNDTKKFKFQQPIEDLTGMSGPGFPDRSAADSRQAFATFGGPHILSLMTEVSTRCLKAVRRQKYNYHRRARPERVGALLTLDAGALTETVAQDALSNSTRATLGTMRARLEPLLSLVNTHNKSRRADDSIREDRPPRADGTTPATREHADPHLRNDAQQLDPANWDDDKNFLLPMAFAEGSPMHPSYGAGHATVAGGCVTMLKAFFHTVENDGSPSPWPTGLPIVEVENGSAGQKLRDISLTDTSLASDPLSISGELNKLAANISIARNMAGVHFYTDYYESLRMGERITTAILIEHFTQIDEPVELNFHSFDGDCIHIHKDDNGTQTHIMIKDCQGAELQFDDWWTRHHPEPSIGFARQNIRDVRDHQEKLDSTRRSVSA